MRLEVDPGAASAGSRSGRRRRSGPGRCRRSRAWAAAAARRGSRPTMSSTCCMSCFRSSRTSVRSVSPLPSRFSTIECAPWFGVPSMTRRAPSRAISASITVRRLWMQARTTSPPMLCASRRIGCCGLLQQPVEELAEALGQHVQRLPPVVGEALDAVASARGAGTACRRTCRTALRPRCRARPRRSSRGRRRRCRADRTRRGRCRAPAGASPSRRAARTTTGRSAAAASRLARAAAASAAA